MIEQQRRCGTSGVRPGDSYHKALVSVAIQ